MVLKELLIIIVSIAVASAGAFWLGYQYGCADGVTDDSYSD